MYNRVTKMILTKEDPNKSLKDNGHEKSKIKRKFQSFTKRKKRREKNNKSTVNMLRISYKNP